MRKLSFFLLTSLLAINFLAVASAANLPWLQNQSHQDKKPSISVLSQLAETLYTPLVNRVHGPIMVADFVDSRHLSSLPPSAEFGAIGQQVAASLLSAGQHYGLMMIETSVSHSRLVDSESERMLSRNSQYLATSKAEYVVTGTINQLPNGMLINARVINLETQQILSAESVFLESHATQRVTVRNGLLYRK